MKDVILQNKVIICAGSGGVGKTTMAASLGCLAAEMGKKVLVLTIDPAKRLKTILGIERVGDVVKVPGQDFAGELYAGTINSKKVFSDFIKEAATNDQAAQRILDNILFKQLSTTLSGSEEFTSIVELYNCYSSGDYDLVILDTPPAQHAIDFLEAPDRIYTLFQSSVTKWFSEQASKKNILTKFINTGTSLALLALQKVTGSTFIDELLDFFTSLKDIQGHISKRCEVSNELLKAKETSFVLISSFDQAKFFESQEFATHLIDNDYFLQAIVVNRAHPTWFKQAIGDRELWLASVEEELRPEAEKMLNYYSSRLKMYDKLAGSEREQVQTCLIPELTQDLTGLQALIDYSKFMTTS